MARRFPFLAMVLLALSSCGPIATPVASPSPLPTLARPPHSPSALPTARAYPPPPTAQVEPTLVPTPEPTFPPPTPAPTPLLVQPTPYAPQEALSADFPTIAYVVKRGQDAAQLWALRYEQGLLREESLLSSSMFGRDSWYESFTFSPNGRYLALVMSGSEGGFTTMILRLADRQVFLPRTPENDGFGLLDWIPGTDRFVGQSGLTWGTMTIDGSSFTRFTIRDMPYHGAVTADGRQFIFTTGRFRLAVIDVDGSDLTPLSLPSPRPEFLASDFALSPDGQACAVTWMRGLTSTQWQGTWTGYRGGGQVWIMNPDGANQRPLSPSDTFSFDPAWSPDGSTLVIARQENLGVYVADPATELISSLWVIDMTTGKEHVLLASESQYAHWSPMWLPDGSGIVFLANRNGESNMWFILPDGSGLQQLTCQGGLFGGIAVQP